MALKCRRNTKTYEPAGDGFDSRDPGLALAIAAGDFSASLARVTRRLAAYAAPQCPVRCRWKTVTVPDTFTDPVFFVRWVPRRKHWHARISVEVMRTVTCAATPPATPGRRRGSGTGRGRKTGTRRETGRRGQGR